MSPEKPAVNFFELREMLRYGGRVELTEAVVTQRLARLLGVEVRVIPGRAPLVRIERPGFTPLVFEQGDEDAVDAILRMAMPPRPSPPKPWESAIGHARLALETRERREAFAREEMRGRPAGLRITRLVLVLRPPREILQEFSMRIAVGALSLHRDKGEDRRVREELLDATLQDWSGSEGWESVEEMQEWARDTLHVELTVDVAMDGDLPRLELAGGRRARKGLDSELTRALTDLLRGGPTGEAS